ncbi:MAG: DUF4440 domain-containing protein [Pseudomonadota bacterium]
MDENTLLTVLRPLEMSLHRQDADVDLEALVRLLHADFEEVGRSGRHYFREDIVEELQNSRTPRRVVSADYRAQSLGDSVALLLYRSAHVDEQGRLHRHSLRSSLWLCTADGWQLRFHQGTPAAAAAWPLS